MDNLEERQQEEGQKLALMSEVLSDGFLFLKLRSYIEHFVSTAVLEGPDSNAAKMLKHLNRVHALCVHIKESPNG